MKEKYEAMPKKLNSVLIGDEKFVNKDRRIPKGVLHYMKSSFSKDSFIQWWKHD